MSVGRYAFEGVARKSGKPFDVKKILGRDVKWVKEGVALAQRCADKFGSEARIKVEDCPTCGVHNHRHYVTVWGWDYVECNECRHIFLSEPPSDETIKRFYAGAGVTYGEEDANWHDVVYGVHEEDRALFDTRVKLIYQAKLEWAQEFVSKGVYLDVACATGESVKAGKTLGWDATGIDSDPKLVAYGRALGANLLYDYFDASNAAKYLKDVDLVSCMNTLEHWNDPKGWCSMVAENMKSGATLMIEVPRTPSLSIFANKVLPNLAYRGLTPPHHPHIFSERSLEICMENAKLKTIAVWTFGQDMEDLLKCSWVNADLNQEPEIDEYLECTPEVQQALDDTGFANTLMILAQKLKD